MGILDEAIREHLELMRKHGAEGPELQKIEDEAFGPPARPGELEDTVSDADAEAPTEFMAQPEAAAAASTEAPETGEAEPAEEPPSAGLFDADADREDAAPSEPPPVEEHPAGEHATHPPEEETPGPETEERMAIAEQPTELHDMEAELGPPEPTPSETELFDAQAGEPRLESGQPAADDLDLTAAEAVPVDEDDDFFDEQSLSDELDQALESPPEDAAPSEDPCRPEDAVAARGGGRPHGRAPAPGGGERAGRRGAAERGGGPPGRARCRGGRGSRFRGTSSTRRERTCSRRRPDFLQDTPEHDRLWFEQKPPKDFDFDD